MKTFSLMGCTAGGQTPQSWRGTDHRLGGTNFTGLLEKRGTATTCKTDGRTRKNNIHKETQNNMSKMKSEEEEAAQSSEQRRKRLG